MTSLLVSNSSVSFEVAQNEQSVQRPPLVGHAADKRSAFKSPAQQPTPQIPADPVNSVQSKIQRMQKVKDAISCCSGRKGSTVTVKSVVEGLCGNVSTAIIVGTGLSVIAAASTLIWTSDWAPNDKLFAQNVCGGVAIGVIGMGICAVRAQTRREIHLHMAQQQGMVLDESLQLDTVRGDVFSIV